MKILQVIPYFCFGGAETMCENLTYQLLKRGHQVTVASLFTEHTPISRRMEEAGVRIVYLDKHMGQDISMIPKLTRLMREQKPDVVHTHLNVIKYAVPAARLAGVPRCVHTVHNVADKEAEGRISGTISRLFFRRGWSVPVALSPLVRDTIVDYYGLTPEKVPTIYNGVDLSRCVPKESYALGEPAKLIHVGRFNEQKNHRGLLEAFHILQRKIPGVELWLLGDGELLEQTKSQAKALGIWEKVRFLGSQKNVYPYLNQGDLFLLPSHYEGMPMTVLEAMGTGLPIVASRVGGLPDMVQSGESGLLTTCDPEAVASACEKLLGSEALRQRLGSRARQESLRFSAETMAGEYEKIYQA